MADSDNILAEMILTMADDELVLAHRDSEWCGHAPILEEDIAFANLALDEIGHALLWYRLYAGLIGGDPETLPDRLVFFREPFEYRASQFAALPKGDWAFSMLRQYLWDALEAVRLEAFVASSHTGLAETAAKIRTEEVYHLRHSGAWVKRLGLGTEESQRRMQEALNLLWPYTGQLFNLTAAEEGLGDRGIPSPGRLRVAWEAGVIPLLEKSGLAIPDSPMLTLDRDLQSMHLVDLLADMQQVARLDPDAIW